MAQGKYFVCDNLIVSTFVFGVSIILYYTEVQPIC